MVKQLGNASLPSASLMACSKKQPDTIRMGLCVHSRDACVWFGLLKNVLQTADFDAHLIECSYCVGSKYSPPQLHKRLLPPVILRHGRLLLNVVERHCSPGAAGPGTLHSLSCAPDY